MAKTPKKDQKKVKRGKFIVIEGGEGSGKSSLIRILPSLFREDEVLITREPGGSPFAEEIRKLMLNHALSKQAAAESQFGLIWAARFDHLKNMVRPAIEAGKHVVTDRFDSSTFAYQIHGPKAGHLKKLFWEMREMYLREVTPDMYIFINVDPAEGLKRVASRKGEINHFDAQKMDFHIRIREGYDEFFSHVPHSIIDGNRPFENVKKDFIKTIKSLCRS